MELFTTETQQNRGAVYSNDGGETWGGPEDMIYDTDGIFVGWRPFKQFDLSAEEDSLHCVYENSYDWEPQLSRGHSISGQDPYFPWFNLGNDTGFEMIKLEFRPNLIMLIELKKHDQFLLVVTLWL